MRSQPRYPSVVYELLIDRFRTRGEPASDMAWLKDQDERHHGGDLYGAIDALDHIATLGVDTVVLSPIWPSLSPIGDAVLSFDSVAEELGGDEALAAFVTAAHARGLRIVLTGIFDRVGAEHDWFRQSQTQPDEGDVDPALRRRSFFRHEVEPFGYAAYRGDSNMPELNLDDYGLRHKLFHGDRSVVRSWLERGADGWRVDHADSLGYDMLREIVRASRSAHQDCLVIGDTRAFADHEVRDGILDGVVNHYLREAVAAYLCGRVPAQELARVLFHQRARYGSRALVRCWNLLSSAGCERILSHLEGSVQRTQLAVQLLFVLPGAAQIFYGDEIGLTGDTLHLARRPMPWDETQWNHDLLALYRRMGHLRKALPALSHGDVVDLTPLGEVDVFAVARSTRTPRETVIAAFNRSAVPRAVLLFVPVEGLVDGLPLQDVFSDTCTRLHSGTVAVEVPPLGSVMLVPEPDAIPGYTFVKDR